MFFPIRTKNYTFITIVVTVIIRWYYLVRQVEGELELIIEDQQFYPKIGEEILIPAHAKHSVKNIGNTANRWLYGYRK